MVKDYVRLCRARGRETFVPLAHPPGHAQVDFGEAVAVIGGVRCKIHFFCMDLPQSDAPFVKAYPHLSRMDVKTTSAADYAVLLPRMAA